jgi:uncharacterized protein with HEPN domain
MKKDPLVYIDDIRDSIEAIKRYTTGLTKADKWKIVNWKVIYDDWVIRKIARTGSKTMG